MENIFTIMLIILNMMFTILSIRVVNQGVTMPYREKIAWLSLAAMAFPFGPYFAAVASGAFAGPLPNLPLLGLFAAAATLQAVILGIGHWYLRRSAGEDARMPPDERDLAIRQRAMSTAYYVLIAGMILAGIVMPFSSSGWEIVNAAIFMIIVAELVHYGVTAFSYRRQT